MTLGDRKMIFDLIKKCFGEGLAAYANQDARTKELRFSRNILARWFCQAKKWYLDEKTQMNCVAMMPQNSKEDGFIIFCSKPIPEEVIRQFHDSVFNTATEIIKESKR